MHFSPVWLFVTHLGAAFLILSLFAVQYLALRPSQPRAADGWLVALVLAMTLTLVSKVMFVGWGWGVAAVDFTGISGHTVLATSVLPVFFLLRVPERWYRFRHLGTAFGVLLAAAVGVSRLVLDAHSVSEVVAGWATGLVVVVIALRRLGRPVLQPWYGHAAILLLSLAFNSQVATVLPTHQLEVRLALLLSGKAQPHTRASFKR